MTSSGFMVDSVSNIMMFMSWKASGGNHLHYPYLRTSHLNASNRCSSHQNFQHLLRASVHSKSPSGIAPTLPTLMGHTSRRSCSVPRASKYSPSKLNNYPPMTEKPQWWWRTLSCIPYLIPLHKIWTCAEHSFYITPFLEELEFFPDSFNWYLESFPVWFWMVYAMALYLGVVRRRRWPHFLRFHVINSVLLENLLDVAIIVCGWMPRAIFYGRIGLHFWTAVAVAYLFTVLECILSALRGTYADVPFVCDAAYIQCDYF